MLEIPAFFIDFFFFLGGGVPVRPDMVWDTEQMLVPRLCSRKIRVRLHCIIMKVVVLLSCFNTDG